MGLVLLLAISIVPQSDMPTDRVDVIELNHFYTGEGKLIFSQWIFLDWNDYKSRHDVVDWSICRCSAKKAPGAVVATKEGWRLMCWHNGILRCIYASQFREIHTQYDREVDEREKLPKEKRRGLSARLREPVLDSTIRTNFIR